MSSSATVKITNKLGMHARPAMILAETAQEFDADISIRRMDQNNKVDAKSIMQLMMLAATKGTELEISATGTDADSSVDRLVGLISSGFNEE
ncbi:MAG: phosphocarrier protein NPr [Phycisphaerae bacterium]|nr:phosphocarrier protein NPr [Phycisphaerae bacterium]